MVTPFSSGRTSARRPSGVAGRSVIPLLVALLLVGLWLARPAADLVARHAGEDSLASIVLADPGPCRSARPQLVIPILDVSDSVIGSGGADPSGRSFDETGLLAAHLARHPCTTEDRFGMVIFAETTVELEPIPFSSLSVIDAALKRPPAHEIGSGTSLDRALDAAAAMAARFPTHDATVVVLSDMVVEQPAAVRNALSRLDRSRLHLVALGDHDAHLDASFATVTELGDASSGEVAEALNDAVIDSRR
ncbi:MAG: hypothetical protein ACRDLB_14470 [Actinomycetota bacterium]